MQVTSHMRVLSAASAVGRACPGPAVAVDGGQEVRLCRHRVGVDVRRDGFDPGVVQVWQLLGEVGNGSSGSAAVAALARGGPVIADPSEGGSSRTGAMAATNGTSPSDQPASRVAMGVAPTPRHQTVT